LNRKAFEQRQISGRRIFRQKVMKIMYHDVNYGRGSEENISQMTKKFPEKIIPSISYLVFNATVD